MAHKSADGFESVPIMSGDGALVAEFVPAVNMLCGSLRYRGLELLAFPHGVREYAEHGRTTGIPLLHPWANRLAGPRYAAAGTSVQLPGAEGHFATDPNGLPIHGALPGLSRWQLTPESGGDRISARLAWDEPSQLRIFPFAHELVLQARVTGDRLTIVTTLRANGGDRVPVAFGFHPYLVLPGSRRRWRVRLGARSRLVLDGRMIPTGEREPLTASAFTLGDQGWDDGLADLASPAEFALSSGEHRLAVRFEEGFEWAQVFAPPSRDFICFEPMTAPANALQSAEGLTVVSPGERYRAVFSVVVG